MDEAINNAISALWERLQEKVLEKAGEALKEYIKKFVGGFNKSKANIIAETYESLNKEKLVEIATLHKVDGSTEVAAYKVDTDDEYLIYLAYTKDKELLDENINKYIIIHTQSIARDIDKLFNNDQLILLK